MNLSDKVKDIRAAIEKNKLVIFVGAGVSKNSGIPTWNGLIKEFAKKINYDKCEKCTHKKKGCKYNECQERYDFTQDEFLKIPQYYFNKSKSHKKYYNLISDTLKSDNKANPLDDIIMRLLPKHIITTNYDKLLENSKEPNTMLYDVIVEDKDLLIHNSNNYIIKMHGDICKPETIVLKEDDYINYQQEHILIETYIKSLLIDHTFLFVGYSLNDYNLKLILGWIQYLAKEHAVNENRPNNYIIQVENAPIKKHIEKYFLSKNIYIINTYDLPSQIIEKYKDIALPNQGKKVYAVLDYIYDDKNDYLLETFPEMLLEKYKIFAPFKRISFKDLISVYSFGGVENKGGNLYFNNKEEFEKLKPIIISTEEKEKSIKKIFFKAGISSIQYNEFFLSFCKEENDAQTIDDELFELYLNNEYFKIITKLSNIKDDNLVAYYYYLILPHMNNWKIKLDEIEKNIVYKNNLYNLVIYKYNRITCKQMESKNTSKDWKEFENIISNIPKHNKKAYGFIKRLSIDGMSEEKLECSNLFEDHKKQFLKTDNLIIFGNEFGKLPELQGISYDYYFNFKYNNLMIDYFSNPRKFFEPYIKAILCTYSPLKERSVETFWGYNQHLAEYKLNSIDFDILIKYTDNKLLQSWMVDYKVKAIKLEKDVNPVDKFINLCNSMKIFGHRYNNTQLLNYLLIITKCNFTNQDKEKIITSLAKLIERDGDKVNGIIVNIIDGIAYIINFYRDEKINSLYSILKILLHNETIKLINEKFNLSMVFRNLFKYSDDCTSSMINILIDSQNNISEKLEMIYTLHYLFSDTQKMNFMKIVKDNISLITSEHLFKYIVDKYISFDESIKEQFISIIEKELKSRRNNPGVQNFPDWLDLTINYCIILHLLKIWENIDCLKPFIAYSDCLAFILDSKNFDYSKVNTNNYMWQNIFRNKEYNNILISHKNDIVTPDLKKALENGYATDNQKKILYKYLLSDNEFWNFN